MSAIWDKKQKIYDRRTKTTRVEFRTLSMIPKAELIEYLNNQYGKPKRKAKALKELTKRGIKIIWEESAHG